MSDDYVTRTLEAYNAHPEQYETATAAYINPELDEFMQLLPRSGGVVLDVGCASGRDTAIMAAAGADAIGLDMSEKLLERANVLHPDVQFRRMDMRELDFADESCKGIWCNMALLHLNDADMLKALREFNRVLMRGGLVVLSLKEGEGEAVIVEKFSSDGERYYNYETIETIQDKLRATGFTITKCYVINERERFGPAARDLNLVWAFATKS